VITRDSIVVVDQKESVDRRFGIGGSLHIELQEEGGNLSSGDAREKS
jgi:hypothetical protein